MSEMSVSKIIVNGRHRKELGDVGALASSIRNLGLLHPIVITPERHLIAGQRRLEAVKSLGWKSVPVREVDGFADAVQLLLAERDENICRKDFSLSEAVAIGKELEKLERPKAKERQGRPGRARSEKFSEHREARSLDQVGSAVGLSRITYSRAKAIVDAAKNDPALAPLVEEMDAKNKVNGVYNRMKLAQAKKHREKTAATVARRHADIRVGDFRKALADLEPESVDVIFTDPPYDKGSIPLYGELAALAARVLKPGGSLVCYAGQHALPAIFPLMQGPLRFQWMMAVRHSGGKRRLNFLRVSVTWKPLLWFVKGQYEGEYLRDLLDSQPGDKLAHDWAQGCAEAKYMIENLSPPGGMVLDPMCGSGTTLAVAKRLGREFLGVDIDRENVLVATAKLRELT